MTTSPAFDAVVAYVGDGRFLPGIPTTELNAGQIAVIARKRGLTSAAMRARLVASGLYAPVRSRKP